VGHAVAVGAHQQNAYRRGKLIAVVSQNIVLDDVVTCPSERMVLLGAAIDAKAARADMAQLIMAEAIVAAALGDLKGECPDVAYRAMVERAVTRCFESDRRRDAGRTLLVI